MTLKLAGKGRLVCVLGPSGVGKDTVMRAVASARPDIRLARRAITRPPDDESEAFDSVSPARFAQMLRAGSFLFHWRAHGLSYGIPMGVLDQVAGGRTVLFNGSRAALPRMRAACPQMRVFLLAVSPEVLARRLAERGRESKSGVAARLTRQIEVTGEDVAVIDNNGDLADTVVAFIERLRSPVGRSS